VNNYSFDTERNLSKSTEKPWFDGFT